MKRYAHVAPNGKILALATRPFNEDAVEINLPGDFDPAEIHLYRVKNGSVAKEPKEPSVESRLEAVERTLAKVQKVLDIGGVSHD